MSASQSPTMIPLPELVARVPGARLRAAPDANAAPVIIRGVHQDSRRVGPGDLFVALRGAHVDAATFIPAAVAQGAAAVLLEAGAAVGPCPVPVIEVPAARLALAQAAALVYGHPTRQLAVLGITGTNGKTTSAHLVMHALEATGRACGIVGTLGYRFRDFALPASHTSPEADELQRIAAEMVRLGASHLAMEVSSIALASARVAEVRFEVGAFTNLTQDHLDYHGTMAAYAEAKDRLFFDHAPAHAVVDVDDAHGRDLAKRLAARGDRELLRVSARANDAAEFAPRLVELGAHGIRMVLRTPSGELDVEAPLVGAHNVSNLVLTFGIVHAVGAPLDVVARAMREVPHVPGRLERCDEPARDDIVAVVDYAHTPDALERVLRSSRALTSGQLWCVFGCGGDRDQSKRRPMGEAVGRAADRAIVTNDNPRTEDPARIAADVRVGLEVAGGAFEVELDRARAIERAVLGASPGDVVLVAGKGHEPYQIIGATVAAFDDRTELRRVLAERRRRRGA